MDKNEFERGEFMDFMDAFLIRHPEVVEDQKRGWNIYWNPRQEAPDELPVPSQDEHAEVS